MSGRPSASVGDGSDEADIPIEYVSVHGHWIAVRRAGQGPVLLLLHGIAGSSQSWVPVMSQLRSEFTMIAPDFVGHGKSAKPSGDYSVGNLASWTRDLLEILGVDRATVVGHSYGGGVALQFAYQFPERCERLVLVDSGGLGREVTWILRLVALPGFEAVMPLLFTPAVGTVGDWIAGSIRRLGVHSPTAAEVWRSLRSFTDPETRRAFLRTTRSVIGPAGQAIAAKERLYLAEGLPVLIVWGERDRVIPTSHAFDAYRALPHSQLEVVPDVGHFPHAESPAAFAEILRDFIHSTEPRVRSPEAARELLRRGPLPASEAGDRPATPAANGSAESRPRRLPSGAPGAGSETTE